MITEKLLLVELADGQTLWLPKNTVRPADEAASCTLSPGYVGRVVSQGAKTAALTGLLREMLRRLPPA